jgi:small subunit ribosomal protein S16
VIWQNGPLATGWSACHSRIGRPREAKPDSGNPPVIAELQRETTGEIRSMAVKIKLTRLGKIRNPQYRIAVADARNRRDGRAIEVIGRYHPKEDPSLIEVDSDRAQYWLSVGAQPTEPVLKLLKITGDWQKFKGLPGTEGTLQVKAPKPSKLELFNAALAAGDGAPSGEATQLKKKKAPAKKAEAAADDAAVEAPAEAAVEAAPADAPAEAPAEAAPADAPVEEAPAEAPAEAAVDAEAPAEADAAAESAEPAAE